MKLLYVGDPHATPSNLPEVGKLMDFVESVVDSDKTIDGVVLLGDQFHTHGVVRLEVLSFWDDCLTRLCKKTRVIALVGNHDMILGTGKNAGTNAMSYLTKAVRNGLVIIHDSVVFEQVGFIGYKQSHEDFINTCDVLVLSNKVQTIVCHQTFQGSTYENGFYAPDGIDLSRVPVPYVFSGHVHSKQTVGKCTYFGTAKWDTMSDANQEKSLHVVEHVDGVPVKIETINMIDILTPIIQVEVNEGDVLPKLRENATNIVALKGSSEWIKKTSTKLKGKCRIKPIPTDQKIAQVSPQKSLSGYLETFTPDGCSKSQVRDFLSRSMGVLWR